MAHSIFQLYADSNIHSAFEPKLIETFHPRISPLFAHLAITAQQSQQGNKLYIRTAENVNASAAHRNETAPKVHTEGAMHSSLTFIEEKSLDERPIEKFVGVISRAKEEPGGSTEGGEKYISAKIYPRSWIHAHVVTQTHEPVQLVCNIFHDRGRMERRMVSL